jgi:hypothetical protein
VAGFYNSPFPIAYKFFFDLDVRANILTVIQLHLVVSYHRRLVDSAFDMFYVQQSGATYTHKRVLTRPNTLTVADTDQTTMSNYCLFGELECVCSLGYCMW